MLFNSYLFVLVFLPAVLCGYFLLRRFGRDTAAKLWLVAGSLVFYGYAVPWYLVLIVSSFLINYFCGFLIRRSVPARRKCILIAALLLDLGCLFYYKYYGFFISNINALLSTDLRVLKVVLPLGISFYTFQQISYVVDCFRGNAPDCSFIDYALFVTFFPQLVAGPIVLHNEIIPQFNDPEKKRFNASSFAAGLFGFSLGMAKKVLLAEYKQTGSDKEPSGSLQDSVDLALANIANPEPYFNSMPNTRFIFFFSPFSMLTWGDAARQGQLERVRSMCEAAFRRLLTHENVTVFFWADDEMLAIQGDLDNYRNATHYNAAVSRLIADRVLAGEGILTEANMAETLDAFFSHASVFPYESLFE